ncbi:beta-lactamase [Thermosipho affectus]|uniref:Beta-lactamase n=1 Tax=Thermosipho affectus TaxID=660294 RepID=A0ABX3IHH1_9BACT|nr:MBL fold metallo-hydrolase [Thermosipho affectus]ONN26768.1 beta-lactamase [Thermosipho affectus]
MNIIAYSKALYTTWIYYSPERILFDSGESVSTLLNNKIYAIKHIFLTHGHVDHISGLWSLINTRNNAMGDREKTLNIYYPKGNKGIKEYLEFIKKMNSDLKFKLGIFPLEEGEKIILREKSPKKYIVPFRVTHTYSEKSFGYHIFEVRKKLKREFQEFEQSKLAELAKKYGGDYISENFEKKILTVSGDTYLLKKEDIKDTEILFHECTFLKKEDRKYKNHAVLEDVLELVKDTNVKKLILYHISGRYGRRPEKYLEEYVNNLNMEIYLVKPEKIFRL